MRGALPRAIFSRMYETILLSNACGDSAKIDSFGAELMAWRAGGEELIWVEDPQIWDQTAPILFPVVG